MSEPWSPPQCELPGRASIPDLVLSSRRERVFLLLAAVFVVAAATLPLLGFGRLFGASWIVRELGREPPVALLVPLGVVAFPIALLFLGSVGALYGRARARALVIAALVVWLGVLGLLWATDHVVAYDNTTTNAFWLGVALVACGLVTCVVAVEAFGLLRRIRGLRHAASALVGVAAGWGVFAAIAANVPAIELPEGELLGVALGAGGYTWLAVVIGAIPLALLVRTLSIYLRVALRPEVDADPDDEPAFVSGKRRALIVETPVPGPVRKRPFTTEEIAFFDAGDELASKS